MTEKEKWQEIFIEDCEQGAENEELVDWIARQFPKMNKLFTEIGCDK